MPSLGLRSVSNFDESCVFQFRLWVDREFAVLINPSVVRCLIRIWKEIETSVKILISTGGFSDTHTGCIPVFSCQGYTFAVQIVFICSLIGMYCTGWDWGLRATRLYITKVWWTSVIKMVSDSLCHWKGLNKHTAGSAAYFPCSFYLTFLHRDNV